jgi:hypothetical protein
MSLEDVLREMSAITAALACGQITPGEAARIAGVYETFVRTARSVREKRIGAGLLQILTTDDDARDDDDDIGGGDDGEDCDP